MDEETVYIVHDHAKIQGKWKIKIKFVTNLCI